MVIPACVQENDERLLAELRGSRRVERESERGREWEWSLSLHEGLSWCVAAYPESVGNKGWERGMERDGERRGERRARGKRRGVGRGGRGKGEGVGERMGVVYPRELREKWEWQRELREKWEWQREFREKWEWQREEYEICAK